MVAEKIAEFAKKWGGPHKTVMVDLQASDDIYAHIIAGDIVSPAQTKLPLTRCWLGLGLYRVKHFFETKFQLIGDFLDMPASMINGGASNR